MERRTIELYLDVQRQVIKGIKNSKHGLFPLQFDESTDVSNNSQLILFAKWIQDDDIVENILCCERLLTTTRGIDIFNLINNIFSKYSLDWSKCLSICTDGAAALPVILMVLKNML